MHPRTPKIHCLDFFHMGSRNSPWMCRAAKGGLSPGASVRFGILGASIGEPPSPTRSLQIPIAPGIKSKLRIMVFEAPLGQAQFPGPLMLGHTGLPSPSPAQQATYRGCPLCGALSPSLFTWRLSLPLQVTPNTFPQGLSWKMTRCASLTGLTTAWTQQACHLSCLCPGPALGWQRRDQDHPACSQHRSAGTTPGASRQRRGCFLTGGLTEERPPVHPERNAARSALLLSFLAPVQGPSNPGPVLEKVTDRVTESSTVSEPTPWPLSCTEAPRLPPLWKRLCSFSSRVTGWETWPKGLLSTFSLPSFSADRSARRAEDIKPFGEGEEIAK